MKLLNKIQQELKAPKEQYNSFGKYKYRNCEDILEAVKPLLGEATLTISDEVVNIGNHNYVKATATLKDNGEEVSTTAYAREALEQKGMNDSQLTGSTSSYARKYALNGLFCIDDTKDSDNTNTHGKSEDVVDIQTPYEKAVAKLKETKGIVDLQKFQKQVDTSTKLSEEEKKQLIHEIDIRLDSLNPTE